MEQALVKTWQERFGSVPPQEWVDRFANPQDVNGCISECQERVTELKEKLEQQIFLLSWLQRFKKRGTSSAQETIEPSQEPSLGDKLAKEQELNSPVCLRRRVLDHVNVRDILAAQRVSLKLKQAEKHLSTSNIDSMDYGNTPVHLPLDRQRSMSDSVVQRPQSSPVGDRKSLVLNRLSPIPDKDLQNQTPEDSEVPNTDTKHLLMEPPKSSEKRLSNGVHDLSESFSDEDGDLLSSVKTVIHSASSVSPNRLRIDGNLGDHEGHASWFESSGTLKRDVVFRNSMDSGEKTPTGSLDTSVDALEKGLTLNMIQEVRSCSLDEGLNLKEAGLIYNETQEDDKESDLEEEGEEEGELGNEGDNNSMTDMDYHTYSNLAESTLTYILRDTIFASRSNSVSSLSGADAHSTDHTPSHEVNMRSNNKRKDRNRTTQERNRTAQVLRDFGSNDDISDEERLQKMLLDLQDSSPSSPSSELSSEPTSPTHLVPYVKPVSTEHDIY